MRHDSPTGLTNTRVREYGAHPTPREARSYAHLSSFFQSKGDVQAVWEFTRYLRPRAAATVLS